MLYKNYITYGCALSARKYIPFGVTNLRNCAQDTPEKHLESRLAHLAQWPYANQKGVRCLCANPFDELREFWKFRNVASLQDAMRCDEL